ncbi:DNA ligase I, ATP-dependent (dnl1) [Spizellomyces punctatus DAOM BR117]|uniref:DNA ligase n=1 Tax=Spizellomyces punctatus (strain DAOM BR117) TaxID=645134 RepID=A0A0L0HUZ5_SPIPD|nr:DNA ligase I, ATP-dependent (dnl1) [Spizellomyces punctatus DAOM BR117]KND05166.1 DNA ligase I, ATP-dependent (dnl1) [Spizellomyces punctatus DAOM BR117]|eukprot:XP_016613205.1 DNA ligase I, ATP-dependent (dnl1) [Spizellomyces punctatus DAOM BR117]
MKDKVLAKTYVEVLGLSMNSPDAEGLINWRNPGKTGKTMAGDFPGVLHQVIAGRSNVLGRSNVTVADINDKLDWLNVTDDRGERRDIIRYFFLNCTPMEQMWIARMILKDLKLGISENTVLGLWHPDALEHFNVTSDLAKVTHDLPDPKLSLTNKEIRINGVFKPMKAKSVENPHDIPRIIGNTTFWVETKLDGERIQMHLQGGKFKWWSRNATPYTSMYGADPSHGSLVPYIYEQFDPKVHSVILDGELLAFNTESGLYEAFGSLKTASNEVLQKGVNAKLHPCFVVFDIVYLNNQSLVDQTLKDRRAYLHRIIKEKETFLEILPHEEASTVEDVINHLGQRIDRSEEGIIIKNPASVYTPNLRGDAWLKLKADYVDTLGDDVDLLIVGGLFGEGRRGGRLSHFMCAIAEDAKPGETPRFISFCKVGSGFKIKEMDELSRYREGFWRPYDPRRPPPWFVHPSNSKEKPDLIISPEHGRIIQVRAAEVNKTETYGAGWTLRFPRFIKVRHDKGLDGVMTVSQLHDYIRQTSERKSQLLAEMDMKVQEKKRKKAAVRRTAAAHAWKVAVDFLGVDASQITKTSDLFNNIEVCVVPGAGETIGRDKHAIETAIVEHGGTAVQNPTKDTTMIIADQLSLKVSNFKRSGQYDIVQSRYIFDCLAANEVLPLNPRYMLYTTEATKEKFKESIDKWGDSYTEDLRTSTMKELFSNMDIDALNKKRQRKADATTERNGTPSDNIAEIEERYFSMIAHEGSLFRRAKVYLDRFHNIRITRDLLSNDLPAPQGVTIVNADEPPLPHEAIQDTALDVVALKLRARGAVIADVISSDTTHVILDSGQSQDLPRRTRLVKHILNTSPRGLHRRFYVVVNSWVTQAIDLGRLPDEKDFEPVLRDEIVTIGGVGVSKESLKRGTSHIS